MQQAHIFVSGFVQGVGFRHFVRRAAEQHSITGWIRNLPDGRVEAVLQGSREDLEQVIELCRKGPMLSEVEDVTVKWKEAQEKFEGFTII